MDHLLFQTIRNVTTDQTALKSTPLIYAGTKTFIYGYRAWTVIEDSLLVRRHTKGEIANALTAASVLEVGCELSKVFNLFMRITLIGKCIQELRWQHARLNKAFEACEIELFSLYPSCQDIDLDSGDDTSSWFSVSTQEQLKTTAIELHAQTLKVMQCAMNVLIQATRLIGFYTDTYLMATGDLYTRHRGISQLTLKLNVYKEQLKEDQATLMQTVKNSQAFIKGYFDSLPEGNKAVQHIQGLLDFAEKSVPVIQAAAEVSYTAATQVAKAAIGPYATLGYITGPKLSPEMKISEPYFDKESEHIHPPYNGHYEIARSLISDEAEFEESTDISEQEESEIFTETTDKDDAKKNGGVMSTLMYMGSQVNKATSSLFSFFISQ